jgi:hypothetical protein
MFVVPCYATAQRTTSSSPPPNTTIPLSQARVQSPHYPHHQGPTQLRHVSQLPPLGITDPFCTLQRESIVIGRRMVRRSKPKQAEGGGMNPSPKQTGLPSNVGFASSGFLCGRCFRLVLKNGYHLATSQSRGKRVTTNRIKISTTYMQCKSSHKWLEFIHTGPRHGNCRMRVYQQRRFLPHDLTNN